MSTHKLVCDGRLCVAKNASCNPTGVDCLESFSAGIAAKDYPALTPTLWNTVYEALGLKTRNIRLIGEPEDVDVLFSTLKRDPGYIGGDVGVGFKNVAWQYMDGIDPLARDMQAINVVVKEDGSLIGYNTDGLGFVDGIRDLLGARNEHLAGKTVMILGGGGTANAIAFALAQAKANLIILNRTVEKAEKLAKQINWRFQKRPAVFGSREQIAINALKADIVVSVIDDPHSPLDQYSALGVIELPATKENLAKNAADAARVMAKMKPETIVCDVMLREKETATLRLAREVGFQTQNGRPMVLNQAIEAFWLVNQAELKRRKVTKKEITRIMTEISNQ